MILLLRTSICAPVNALDMFISHYFLGSGSPQTLIQSCLTIGTFSYIIEKLNKQQPALALPPATGVKAQKGAAQNVLPPFTLQPCFDQILILSKSSFCFLILKYRF
jgi:hypothetical protein